MTDEEFLKREKNTRFAEDYLILMLLKKSKPYRLVDIRKRLEKKNLNWSIQRIAVVCNRLYRNGKLERIIDKNHKIKFFRIKALDE